MQEVATYGTATEAHVDKAYLESEGIEVLIYNEHIAGAFAHFGLIEGVKLLVKDVDANRAQQLLKNYRQ